MKIKRIISFILALLLLVGTATSALSCSKTEPTENGGGESGKTDPAPEPQPEPEPEKKDTLLYDPVPDGFIEEKNATVADPKGTADLASLLEMGHPRVMMNRADFDRLKSKVGGARFQNKTLYKLHKLLLSVADEAVADNTVIVHQYDAAGKRILEWSQLALKRIGSCAYAYRMTGSQKYLDKAISDLEAVTAFDDWNQGKHFLDTAEMTFAVALGYDWLYYNLPYALRVKCRKCITNYDLAYAGSHSFRTTVGNWNQVCYGGTVAGAVAIYGKEKTNAGSLINSCITDNASVIKSIYDPDGVYPEGYSYWGYGTGYQGVIFTVLESAFGQLFGMDNSEGLRKTSKWMMMMAGVGSRTYCFGDSTGSTATPKMGMWWFGKHYADPSLLSSEVSLLNSGAYTTTFDEIRLLPMAVACANDIENLDSASSGSATVNMYSGGGTTPVVLFRTLWDNSDADRYLGLKGGQANSAHGHMDAGSFVYDALGLRWSEDITRESYARVENALKAAGGNFWNLGQTSLRWQVFRLNNKAHSTLTVNGADHNVNGAATVESVSSAGGQYTARLNLSAPLSDQVASAYRTFTLKDGVLTIEDEITAKSSLDAAVQWRMMTPSAVSAASDKETLTQNGKTMYLRTTPSDSSVSVKYTSWEAKGTNSWDTACTGYTLAGFEATVPKGRTVTFTTVLSPTL